MQLLCSKSFCWISADFMKLNIFTLSLVAAILVTLNVDSYASRSVTLYSDGAQVERRETAKKGYLEIYLPPDALQDSLRIAPGSGAEIVRVETAILKPAKSIEKELTQLYDREGLLNDRLKALAVREDIFKAAAKSQSAKAPRRTKTNPEPLSAIKQGTDYAITQLEAVYFSKRKTEKELATINVRRTNISKDEQAGGTVAKIWVTPAGGSVTATWQQSGRKWIPHYQIRVADNNSAILTVMAPGISISKGESVELALASLQAGDKTTKYRYEGEWAVLKKELFTVTTMPEANASPQTFTFSYPSTENLPPGDISCYKAGVYIGKGRFKGASTGRTTEIICHGI